MEKLPDELLLMIFRYIDDSKERGRLELVCRKWRQIMLNHGWKLVRRIAPLCDKSWIEPIGVRCGHHLVECSFSWVNIDVTLIRLIAEHFPTLKHLEFRSCKLNLASNVFEPFRTFGTRLRSLTFFQTFYHSDNYLLRHFPRLRHLCLDLGHHLGIHLLGFNHFGQHNVASPPTRFSTELLSLCLNNMSSNSPDLQQILTEVLKDSPNLSALYMEMSINSEQSAQLLSRISVMKSLRFLRIAFFDDFTAFDFLCSCLNNLPQLIALQLTLPFQQLSTLFGSPSFRGLVHLRLFLRNGHLSDNFEPIGLLSTAAPQLRSLSLDLFPNSLYLTSGIGCELLKIARNGILEYLNVPCASFTVAELDQLIRDCPNLHTLVMRLWQNEPFPQFAELRRVVADQWSAGTRNQWPLRIWIYTHPEISLPDRVYCKQAKSAKSWSDAFLAIHLNQYVVAPPPNPVLKALFRDEVFSDDDSGGTPSFVTKHYQLND